jgi:predicted nucleotidyltransferase
MKDDFVFVGGCATGLLVTDAARPPVRVTTDVDLVTEIATRTEYYELADRLRQKGFVEDAQSTVICRWRVGRFQVDIMPANDEILGFNNRWHQDAIDAAEECTLPSGTVIRLVTPEYFLATKLEAFHDRGEGDYAVSHDIEDIITVIDGRQSIVTEVLGNDGEVRIYIRDEFDRLLGDIEFTDSISWHLPGDRANQERVPLIIGRMREIAEI